MEFSLRKSLRHLRSTSADERSYLPEGELAAVLTTEAIYGLLCHDPAIHPDKLIDRVNEAHLRAPKVLATLIHMESMEYLVSFLDAGLYDERLPFCKQDFYLEPPNEKLVDDFLHAQHEFLAPVFFRGASYDSLDSKHILPFIEDKYISEGAFGVVSKIRIHANHQHLQPSPNGDPEAVLFARKQFKISPDCKTNFEKEKGILQQLLRLEHPNILPLLATYSQGDRFNMVFPFAETTLHEYLRSDAKPEARSLFKKVYGLIEALHHLHNFTLEENGRVLRLLGYHHDLKPLNILIQDGKFVIADFGLANIKDADQSSKTSWKKGTGAYSPPEATNGSDVGRAYDIWSLGCILAEVATFAVGGREGVEEFARCRVTQTAPSISQDYFHDGYMVKPEVIEHFSNLILTKGSQGIVQQVLELVTDMLKPVANRPTSQYVLQRLARILSMPDYLALATSKASVSSSIRSSNSSSVSQFPAYHPSLLPIYPFAYDTPIPVAHQPPISITVSPSWKYPIRDKLNPVTSLPERGPAVANITRVSTSEGSEPNIVHRLVSKVVSEVPSGATYTSDHPSTTELSPNDHQLIPMKRPQNLLDRLFRYFLSFPKSLRSLFKPTISGASVLGRSRIYRFRE